jgi:hypothetical protein
MSKGRWTEKQLRDDLDAALAPFKERVDEELHEEIAQAMHDWLGRLLEGSRYGE